MTSNIPDAAKKRMKEIFESKLVSGSNIDKIYADKKESEELQKRFNIFETQVSKWFNDTRNNHKKKIKREQEKKKKLEEEEDGEKEEEVPKWFSDTRNNHEEETNEKEPFPYPMYPFPAGFRPKGYVPKGSLSLDTQKPKRRFTRQGVNDYNAQKCKCSGMCLESYEDLMGMVSMCKQVTQLYDEHKFLRVIECTDKNCPIEADCGNKYSDFRLWHIGKTVVSNEFVCIDGNSIRGLKVQEKAEIPEWGVIGEYTGTIIKGKKPKSKLYVIQVGEKEWIDAENEGNSLRFINHRCQNPNAVYISVTKEGEGSIFVKAIRKIKGGEFISINYGPDYSIVGCQCLDCISE
jgi:hypothetical protein